MPLSCRPAWTARLASAVRAVALAATLTLAGGAAAIAQEDIPFTAADIEAAVYEGGDLPSGRSALTAKVQILLDRAGVSPGVVDGYRGGMSMTAISAYERKMGLRMDGIMDYHVWAGLQQYADAPVTQEYTITEEDAEGLVDSIPTDYAEKAQMAHLGYTSVTERLAERFHMDEKFIRFLNPGKAIIPGETITVMAPAKRLRATVTQIIIDKEAHRVAAYDAKGRLVVDYPATIGSTATPSPSGSHKVTGVALNPEYTYNPAINFKQGDNDRPLRIPPGPNGPVGSVWIALDRPTYGIHGTPSPSQLFLHQSHGCVRLTNWDAEELAHMVRSNQTEVLFLESGIRIADVTEPVTLQTVIGSDKPRPRPAGILLAAAAGLTKEAPETSTETVPPATETILPSRAEAATTITLPAEYGMPDGAGSDSAPAATDTGEGIPAERMPPGNMPAEDTQPLPATPETTPADPLADALETLMDGRPSPLAPAPESGVPDSPGTSTPGMGE